MIKSLAYNDGIALRLEGNTCEVGLVKGVGLKKEFEKMYYPDYKPGKDFNFDNDVHIVSSQKFENETAAENEFEKMHKYQIKKGLAPLDWQKVLNDFSAK